MLNEQFSYRYIRFMALQKVYQNDNWSDVSDIKKVTFVWMRDSRRKRNTTQTTLFMSSLSSFSARIMLNSEYTFRLLPPH